MRGGGGGYWGLSLSPSVHLLPPGAGALGAPRRTVHRGRDTQALWVGFPAPREVSSQGWGAHWGRSPCGRPSSGPHAETWTVSPSRAGTKDAASRRRRPWGGYLGGRDDRARALPPQPPAGSRRAEGVSSQLLKPAWGWGWSSPPSSSPSQAAGPASWIPEALKAAPTAARPPHPAFPPPSSLGREQALPAPGVLGRPGTLLLCSPAPSSSLQKDAQAAGGVGDTGVSARPKSGAVTGGRAGLCRAAGAGPAWMKDGIPLPALSWGPQGHGAP